jgi:hypothetical protein
MSSITKNPGNKEMKLRLINLLSQNNIKIEGAFTMDITDLENFGKCQISFTLIKKNDI